MSLDYGRLFATSWYVTWRYKFLWLFGFLASMSAVLVSLVRLAAGPRVFRGFITHLEQLATQPSLIVNAIDRFWQQISLWLTSGIVVLTIISLVSWLIILLAQGGIIGTAVDFGSGRPIGFTQALKHSWNLLGRFVAIDTIVYLPLFLAVLLIMLLCFGILLSILISTMQAEATPVSLLTPLLIGGLCILPSFCLLVPLGMLTAAFRGLAFRDTAVLGTGIRQAMRHTWEVIKGNLAAILILGVLVWGFQVAIDLGLRLIMIPLYGLVTVPGFLTLIGNSTPVTLSTLASQFVSMVFELLVLFVQTIVHTFTAVVWTLAYKEISSQRSVNSSQTITAH